MCFVNLSQNGTAPLHCAANRGNFDAVIELVERGADIHVMDKVSG